MTNRSSKVVVPGRRLFSVFVSLIMVTVAFASIGSIPDISVDDTGTNDVSSDNPIELIEIDEFYASPPKREYDFGEDPVRDDFRQDRMDAYDLQRETSGREVSDHNAPIAAGGSVPVAVSASTGTEGPLPYGYTREHWSEVDPTYTELGPIRFPTNVNEEEYITYSAIPTTPILYSVEPETGPGGSPLHFEKILLVDDDESRNNGGIYTINSCEDPAYGTDYQDTLQDLGYAYDVYTVQSGRSGPSIDVLDDYDLVIWVHGFNSNWNVGSGPTLSTTDQMNLEKYFDLGGFVWMTGSMWAVDSDLGAGGGIRTLEPGDFLYDYMHILETGLSFGGQTTYADPMYGSEGGIEDGEKYVLDSNWTEVPTQQGICGQIWPQLGQGVKPVYNADPDYYYHPYHATSWEGSYKYVLMGVEWSWINVSDRSNSMQNILEFFFPPRDYGCHVSPAVQSEDAARGGVASYTMNITNTGTSTGLDVYDISYVTTEGWEIQFFEADGSTPLTDNNLNGFPDTSVIGQYENKNVVVKVFPPIDAVLGVTDSAEVTFRSQEDTSFTKNAALQTTVPSYGGKWTPAGMEAYAREDDWVMLDLELMNGADPDTLDLTYTSSQGWAYTFYEADGITELTNTGGSGAVDTGVMSSLEYKTIRVRVTVPGSNPPGTIDNAIITSTSVADTGANGDAWLNLTIAHEIEYNEDVESGESDFTHDINVGVLDLWTTSTIRSNGGTTSWSSGKEIDTVSDTYLESPYIFLEYRNAPSAKMDFYHWYNFFDASYYFEDGLVDGGVVEVWDGVTRQWNYIVPDDGYDGALNADFMNPLGGLEGFGGSSGSAWKHDYFDIYSFILNGINRVVLNETSTPPGGTTIITLANNGVIDITLYRLRGGSWYLMDDRDDYALDPAKGEVTLTPVSQAGDSYHAFYNYTLGNVVKFRWRVGYDIQGTYSDGWFIDDIRVRMPEYGAIVKPDNQEGWGYDGDEVSFNFTVENIGWGGTDQYDLAYATNQGWVSQFYDDSWNLLSPARTPLLSPGVTKAYYVNISIPGGHTGGYDFGAVWVNSTMGGTDESIGITAIRPYVAYWSEDFESGLAEYIYLGNGVGEVPEWHLSPNVAHSPANSLYFGQEDVQNYGASSFGIIDSPLIEIPSGGNYAELSIWHDYDFEPGFDGGLVEIGSENGTVYEQILPERGYDWNLAVGWGNYGLEGKSAFSGITGTYIQDVFEISDYIGKVIRVSFVAGGDAIESSHRGWNIDDISVYAPNYGVGVSQDKMPGFGDPNGDAVYEIELRNKGKNTDTFTFSDSSSWTFTYLDDQWNTLSGGLTSSMVSGEARTYYINVSIPGTAFPSVDRSDIVTVTSTGNGSVTETITLSTFVADPLLLVIDDFEGDMGSGGALYDGYEDLLDATYGTSYDWIDIEDHGLPTLAGLQKHTGVIWATRGTGGQLGTIPMDPRPPLQNDERDLIGLYLDDGGRMYLAGNIHLGAAFGGYGGWAEEYFGWGPNLNWGNWDGAGGPGAPSDINGTAGTMMAGMNLNHAPILDGHPDADDIFSVDWDGGVSPFRYMFHEGTSNDACGLYLDEGVVRRMATTFQIVNIGVANSTHTRDEVMQEVIDFLFPTQDVWLSPKEKSTISGLPGTDVSYTLEIRNAGRTADTFSISATGGTWTVQFFDENWDIISSTGSIQPDELMVMHVNVSIPGVANPSDLNITQVRIDGGGYWVDKNLTTVVPHSVPYNYNAETAGGWAEDPSSSLWHRETSRKHGGSWSWAFNDGSTYDTGNVEKGSLYSPWIDLSGGSLAELTWWEYVDTEGFGVPYDTCWVYVSTDGNNWDQVFFNPASTGVWVQRTIDLNDYIGNAIILQFYFDTSDTNKNDFEGWFIDDVQVYNPAFIATYDRSAYYGFGDAGETITYSIMITNTGSSPDTFSLDVLGEAWTATIYDETHTSVISNIALDPRENTTVLIDITISGGAAQSDDDVGTFRAISTGDASQWDVGLNTYVKDPVLLVSDDFEKGIDTYYRAMLDANSYGGVYAYDWIDTYTRGGSPSAQNMLDHEIVIWHTVGSGASDPSPPWNPGMLDNRQPLTQEEMDDITLYLDNGGRMYLSSNAPFSLKNQYYLDGDPSPVIWAYDYFGMEAYTNFPWPYPMGDPHYVYGVDDDPVGDGFKGLNQIGLHTGDAHPDCKEEGSTAGKYDWYNKEAGFESAFEENWWNFWATGTTLDNGTVRRVFTTWDLAAVDTSAHRNELMRRILTFLTPPPTGVTVSPNTLQGQAYAGDHYLHELTVKNIGATSDIYDITIPSSGWVATLYETDGVTLLSNHGGSGAPDTGELSPLETYTVIVKVQIPGASTPGDSDLVTIRATSVNDGSTWLEANIETSVPFLILLVDDDGSSNNGGEYGPSPGYWYAEDPTHGAPGHGTPYADELTNLGYQFDTYVVAAGVDGPPQDILNVHPIVIWVCGGALINYGTLNSIDQVRLANFLDNGGRLWLDSPSIPWDLVGSYPYSTVSPGNFVYEYLGINETDNSNLDSPATLTGVTGSIMAGESYGTTTYWEDDGHYAEVQIRSEPGLTGAWDSDGADTLPYTATQWNTGVFKVFYTGVEWAHITTSSNRRDAMGNIMSWFLPEEDVIFTPSTQDWYGIPGSFVWYNMTVQNTGNNADSFSLSRTSPNSWTYSYFESDMITPLSGGNTGPIASYGRKSIAVRVSIPGGASGGTWEDGKIRATSDTTGTVFSELDVNTFVYEAPGTDPKSVYIGNMPERDGGATVSLFSDDVEGGTNGWTQQAWITNPDPDEVAPFTWHIVDPSTLPAPSPPGPLAGHSPAHSPDNVWWYGNDSSGEGGYVQSGWWARLESPSIDLSGYTSIELKFWERHDLIQFFPGDRIIEINTGSGWVEDTTLPYLYAENGLWLERIIDLSAYAGQNIQVGFNYSHNTAWDKGMWPGWYVDDVDVNARALPADSDKLLENSINWVTGGGTVDVSMIDSYGTGNQDLWDTFSARHGTINVNYMVAGPFTFGDLVLTEADVLLIGGASREYSDIEIAAILQYVNDGHGIIGTGDFMDHSVLGNKELAPLFGLKNEVVAWGTVFTEYEVDIPSHPVMAGLSNPFSPGDPLALRVSTGAMMDGAIVLAHADTIDSGVIAVMESDLTAPSFGGLTGGSVVSSSQINLNWAPASDLNPTITYNLYMTIGAGSPPTSAPSYTTTNTTGVYISGLAPSTQYTFIVRAEDAYGNEETNSVTISRTTQSGAGSDGQGPAIMDLFYGTDQTGDILNIQYKVSDIGLGDSNLMTSGYVVPGEFSAYFTPRDGAYDSPAELVQGTIDISSLAPNAYQLQIWAQDVYGNWGNMNVFFTKGPKFTKMLYAGWSYVSIPLDVLDNSISGVLASISGDYNAVQFYNNTGSGEGWEHYNIDDPLFADIDYIDHEMGFWVNVTSSSVLVVSGTIPGSTGITLREGWNMVGYPSQSTTSSIGDKLSTITYDKIAGPDQYGLNTDIKVITDLMIPGSGYWIHVPAGTGTQTWTVT